MGVRVRFQSSFLIEKIALTSVPSNEFLVISIPVNASEAGHGGGVGAGLMRGLGCSPTFHLGFISMWPKESLITAWTDM